MLHTMIYCNMYTIWFIYIWIILL